MSSAEVKNPSPEDQVFCDKINKPRLSDDDLEFLVHTAAAQVTDKANLKRIIQEDPDFR